MVRTFFKSSRACQKKEDRGLCTYYVRTKGRGSYLWISRFLKRVTVTSSACVLIFKTHSFRFLHCSESHYRCFESTLRYAQTPWKWLPIGQWIWGSISYPSRMLWWPFRGRFLQILKPKGVFWSPFLCISCIYKLSKPLPVANEWQLQWEGVLTICTLIVNAMGRGVLCFISK